MYFFEPYGRGFRRFWLVILNVFSQFNQIRIIFCFRGKGDYHRLGHGTDEHVRKPKKVAAFAGKKVVDIATGSLHCVAVTSTGEVFTWGDNDEGQQGDGTTNAVQRPRVVMALQGMRYCLLIFVFASFFSQLFFEVEFPIEPKARLSKHGTPVKYFEHGAPEAISLFGAKKDPCIIHTFIE